MDLIQTDKQQVGLLVEELLLLVMMTDEDLVTTARAHKIKLIAATRAQGDQAMKMAISARNRIKELEDTSNGWPAADGPLPHGPRAQGET